LYLVTQIALLQHSNPDWCCLVSLPHSLVTQLTIYTGACVIVCTPVDKWVGVL